MFTTQSLWDLKFANVWVSVRRPRTIVQPSSQNDEIGARFGLPSGLTELTIATGLRKYRMIGVIALKSISQFLIFSVIMKLRLDAPSLGCFSPC